MWAFLGWWFPGACGGCGAPLGGWRGPLCLPCQEALDRLGLEDRCEGCREWYPLPGEGRCRSCMRRPPPWDRLWAGASYEGVMRKALHRFKFEGRIRLGTWLYQTRILSLLPLPPARGILPVPLHPRRLRQREFNPALVGARVLGALLGIPVFPQGLRRLRPTPSQVGRSWEERQGALEGVFQVDPGLPVADQEWYVVDDVLTTGATLGAVARALREAGARRVFGVVLARTLRAYPRPHR